MIYQINSCSQKLLLSIPYTLPFSQSFKRSAMMYIQSSTPLSSLNIMMTSKLLATTPWLGWV